MKTTKTDGTTITIEKCTGCKDVQPRRKPHDVGDTFVVFNSSISSVLKCKLDYFDTPIENYEEWSRSREGMQAIEDAAKSEETGVSIIPIKHEDKVVGYKLRRKFKKLGELSLSTILSATKYPEACEALDSGSFIKLDGDCEEEWLASLLQQAPDREDGKIVLEGLAKTIKWNPNPDYPNWIVNVYPVKFAAE